MDHWSEIQPKPGFCCPGQIILAVDMCVPISDPKDYGLEVEQKLDFLFCKGNEWIITTFQLCDTFHLKRLTQ
jgi:aerobic-type carbon monoxide dehydrogenase small subunit (CoxS/CutS family)